MNINHDDLQSAAVKAGIPQSQVEVLWQTLNAKSATEVKPRFDVAHVAYYLGALIVIGAMGWFMNEAWDALGGPGITGVALAYALCFVLGGRTLWNQGQRVPGGLLIAIAVCMAPLATFGIERWTGLWPAGDPGSFTRFHPYIDGSWVIMEAVTIAAGVAALRFWRFPFLTAPIAYSLWYMSMDLSHLLIGNQPYTWEEKQMITAIFGAAMIVASYVVDLRGKRDDYAFWGYLFGLAAFWGGLSSMDSGSEFAKAVYALINLGLIAAALLLRRRVFLVFGGLGLFGYLGHLAYRVFKDMLIFPFALSLLGILVIYLGLLYQRRQKQIERRVRELIVPHIRSLIPPRVLTD